MWRYEPLLPADLPDAVTLEEGWTPHYRASALAEQLQVSNLWIKDDGRNPTDSFKARGMSAAVTMAKRLGARKLAVALGWKCRGRSGGVLCGSGLRGSHLHAARRSSGKLRGV